MREWILQHPHLAPGAFIGGLIVVTVAVVLGALEFERWWQDRRDCRRLVAEVEAALAEAAEGREDRNV